MSLLEKYSCIFCKYRKLNKNHDYACMDSWNKDESGYPIGKCNSLSNIYYGRIANFFPFKQIDYWRTEREHIEKKKSTMKRWIRNMEIVVWKQMIGNSFGE